MSPHDEGLLLSTLPNLIYSEPSSNRQRPSHSRRNSEERSSSDTSSFPSSSSSDSPSSPTASDSSMSKTANVPWAFANSYLFDQLQAQAVTSLAGLQAPRSRGWLFESQLFWLGLYFCFNLGLTLFNKGVLLRFPFPYTLTALHCLFATIGGNLLRERRVYTPARLSKPQTIVLVCFSVLYAVNIVVSNVSLHLVTVPFHQVVRSSTPIFTIALSALLLRATSSWEKIISLIPVIIGVAFATYGDYYFTIAGLILTLVGTFLAALKTIYTNVLQSRTTPSLSTAKPSFFQPPRLQLHPLDLLTRMAPLAFIQCVFFAYITGELTRVRRFSATEMTTPKAGALMINSAIAFGLNVVSFTANKKAGPLSMCVAGNVKQVLTIVAAVVLFDLSISRMNALGISLTLLGGAWYAFVDYKEKRLSSSVKL